LTPSSAVNRRVAVVGGGIAGLSAAYTLAKARREGAPVEGILLEASDRLGGVIQSEQVEGCVVEAGPDSFLTEKPEAAALARELGLGGLLTGSNDSERKTYILHRGKLQPLPDGLMLLVPTRVWPMITTPLLPLSSKFAMAGEWFQRPRANAPQDESVADFVTRHFGPAMLENIADPLLAGVYGGNSARLSVRSVLARFWKMEREQGSLTRATLAAMRKRRANAAGDPPPLFMTLQGGLSQLTAKLAAQLDPATVFLRRRVETVERGAGAETKNFRARLEDGARLEFDAVILALPAPGAARILADLNAPLAGRLAEIPYSSAMTVSMGFEAHEMGDLLPGFGFLVPAKERRRLLACTFVHRKFPENVDKGRALLRCFLGGSRDAQVLGLGDDEALSLVRGELGEILGLSAGPLFTRVHRWPDSMAQYVVGHQERLRAINSEVEILPGIYLAGNAYSGIGLSDCIRTGRAAAERALAVRES
jgi:protoporphyrinogen/coproporphyrinogen III oxidase